MEKFPWFPLLDDNVVEGDRVYGADEAGQEQQLHFQIFVPKFKEATIDVSTWTVLKIMSNNLL